MKHEKRYFTFFQWVIVFMCSTLLVTKVQAETSNPPSQLVFCHEDQNAFPWVMIEEGKSQGLDIEVLKLVAKELSVNLEFEPLPWKRCLLHLQNNKVDGAFAASFKAERLAMGRYPVTKKGNLDANKRIHTSGYALYIPKHSDVGWNGETFINLDGDISIQNGFSIGDRLRALNINVLEFMGPKANLVKVMEGKVEGSALQSDRADQVLRKHPDLAAKVSKYPVPISSKPYYLMLSFKLALEHPEFTDLLWRTLEKVRDSKAMTEAQNRFYDSQPQ